MGSFSVLFSLPDTTHFQRFTPDDVGDHRFIVAPFEGEIVSWNGSLEDVDPQSWNPRLNPAYPSSKGVEKAAYERKLEQAIAWCEANEGKVVMSRFWDDERPLEHPGKALVKLRQAHPKAFVYGLEHEEHGCWMGATPEVLLTKDNHYYKTMSLAGTKLAGEEWTDKEYREQKTVTDYILSRMNASAATVEGPEDSGFGALRHLRSIIRWTSDQDVLSMADQLHPTPAVGGFPVEQARHFISAHEGYDRSLYTGFLGVMDAKDRAQLFVNLRCMQLFRDRVRFYAGGGINQWSNPEAEWKETERKIESTRSAI